MGGRKRSLAVCQAAGTRASGPRLDKSEGQRLLAAQAPRALSRGRLGTQPVFPHITALQADSRMMPEVFEQVVQLAVSGCRAVGEEMRRALLEHTRRLAVCQRASHNAGQA